MATTSLRNTVTELPNVNLRHLSREHLAEGTERRLPASTPTSPKVRHRRRRPGASRRRRNAAQSSNVEANEDLEDIGATLTDVQLGEFDADDEDGGLTDAGNTTGTTFSVPETPIDSPFPEFRDALHLALGVVNAHGSEASKGQEDGESGNTYRDPHETHPSVFHQYPPDGLPLPVSTRHDTPLHPNASFIRLNFALLSVLLHIFTQDPPLSEKNAFSRIKLTLHNSALFLPLFLLIILKPRSSHVSDWIHAWGVHAHGFWIRFSSLVLIVLINIALVVAIFQHLPRWMGIFLVVLAVTAFTPFLVVILILGLLNGNHNKQLQERSLRVVVNVVYASLVVAHLWEMQPSLLNTVLDLTAEPRRNLGLLNIAVLCLNAAIVLQLPALFLEASCIGFCQCSLRKDNATSGAASLLLTVFFQLGLSTFMTAIAIALKANDAPWSIFGLYIGCAIITFIIVVCYQLEVLPGRSLED